MRFWVSWCEPVGDDGDYRPRSWPLPPSIPAYWCSGWAFNGEATLCAIVDADSEDAARSAVSALWSPSAWRFVDLVPPDWRPPADRFPWPEAADA